MNADRRPPETRSRRLFCCPGLTHPQGGTAAPTHQRPITAEGAPLTQPQPIFNPDPGIPPCLPTCTHPRSSVMVLDVNRNDIPTAGRGPMNVPALFARPPGRCVDLQPNPGRASRGRRGGAPLGCRAGPDSALNRRRNALGLLYAPKQSVDQLKLLTGARVRTWQRAPVRAEPAVPGAGDPLRLGFRRQSRSGIGGAAERASGRRCTEG